MLPSVRSPANFDDEDEGEGDDDKEESWAAACDLCCGRRAISVRIAARSPAAVASRRSPPYGRVGADAVEAADDVAAADAAATAADADTGAEYGGSSGGAKEAPVSIVGGPDGVVPASCPPDGSVSDGGGPRRLAKRSGNSPRSTSCATG